MSSEFETYIKITLKNVPSKLEDLITGFCFEYGALGVSEQLDFRQTSLQYDPEIIEKPFLTLEVFFETRPSLDFQKQLLTQYPMVEVILLEEAQKDWNEEWKKGFKEFELVSGVWVVPSWRTPPHQASFCLNIDPGMAFGTGTHETTQLASKALKEISEDWPSDISVLDVGTGTAILAMLATHLGAKKVVATEIDPIARDVGRENIARNNMQKNISILNEQVETVSDRFPLVMANIIDGVLVNIQESLKSCLQPGGQLLLTGVLLEREEFFKKNFLLPENYDWFKRWQMGEWVALLGGPQ